MTDEKKVVRLNERRGESAMVRPVEKIDEILTRDDAESYIKTMNPHGLYRLIQEAGFDQGMDLIPYASPEQIQIFVDLDCWKRDVIETDRVAAWLAVLVADADDAHFHRAVRDLDPEVMALFFKKSFVAVELVEDGEIPAGMPSNTELSPDNAYALVYPEEQDIAALLRALLQRIYDLDMGLAWTLLEAVRWELASEMEETAYRFRTSRLEELGFVERTEALEVYALVQPVKLRERWESGEWEAKVAAVIPDDLQVPAVVRASTGEDLFFFEVLETVEDGEAAEALLSELAVLSNRTMLADGIEPGELESGQEVVRRTTGFLSLGLEFLSRGEEDRAREALSTVALKTLFQVGHSIAQNLRQKSRHIEDRPTLSLVEGVPFSLLSPDEAALFEGLQDLRPSYARDRYEFEVFNRQKQVDDAAVRIGMVAFKQLWLFGVQQKTVEELAPLVYEGSLKNEPDRVSFDVFFATAVATLLVAGKAELRGLTVEELGELPAKLRERSWEEDMLGAFEPVIGPILVAMPAATARLATRWLEETLERLVDELAAVEAVEEVEPLLDLVLVENA